MMKSMIYDEKKWGCCNCKHAEIIVFTPVIDYLEKK